VITAGVLSLLISVVRYSFLPWVATAFSRNQAAMGVNAEAINMMTKV
jgi:hypothetical protein